VELGETPEESVTETALQDVSENSLTLHGKRFNIPVLPVY
jgi:hypothetical protein